jgi:nucleoid-associated protein YgaU
MSLVINTASYHANPAVYQHRRWGVVAAAAAVAALSLFAIVGAAGSSAHADQSAPGQAMAPRVVIALPGDTLWAIARRVIPNGSITELVDRLVQMNGDKIAAGQEVRIP